MLRKFYEYVSERDTFESFKAAILNALEATEDAVDDPLANFEKAKDLANPDKNPAVVDLIEKSSNKDSIIMAIENARQTQISIADLLGLYQAEGDAKMSGSQPQPSPRTSPAPRRTPGVAPA